VRDAIVLSGWTWEASNVPERIASALSRGGSRVLYCENPQSFARTVRPFGEVEKNVFALGLRHFSHRLNAFPVFQSWQASILAKQILERARNLQLENPVLIYPHGDYCLALCREFKRQSFQIVHVCMDYELNLVREHVREADLALVIPQAAFEELRQEFGPKVRKIPQLSYVDATDLNFSKSSDESPDISHIPRPRLGYLGGLEARVAVPLLRETLSRHPDWQFVHFGDSPQLALPNEHVLPWRSRPGLAEVTARLNIGFMPYDCNVPKNLHCVPLKLFDYFALGLPVVSTPIAFLRGQEDLVYLGSTPAELEDAISRALAEPDDSSKKAVRLAVACAHSIEHSARILSTLLGELPIPALSEKSAVGR
jgi:Glycosyl transferases group 1